MYCRNPIVKKGNKELRWVAPRVKGEGDDAIDNQVHLASAVTSLKEDLLCGKAHTMPRSKRIW